MGWLIGILAVLVPLALFWVLRGGLYRRLFSPGHVGELANAGLQIRSGLRKLMEDRPALPAFGPAQYRSHEGVLVICSIHRVDGKFIYHVSLSHESGVMAFAAGGRFLYLIAGALGVHEHLTAVAHTPVTHGMFTVPAGEQEGLRPDFESPRSEKEARELADRAGRFLGRLHSNSRLLGTEEEILQAAGLA